MVEPMVAAASSSYSPPGDVHPVDWTCFGGWGLNCTGDKPPDWVPQPGQLPRDIVHSVTSGFGLDITRFLADAADHALGALLGGLGKLTEPDFNWVLGQYGHMKAMALGLLGAFVSLALIEHILGGAKGGHVNLVGRAAIAAIAAGVGLAVVATLTNYTAELSNGWAAGIVGSGPNGQHPTIADVFHNPDAYGDRLSFGVIALTAVISLLLSLAVFGELVLRSVLLLTTAVFIPLVAVMAIWPRFAAGASHLVELMVTVVLSKLAIVVCLALGFDILSHVAGGQDQLAALLGGLGILLLALVSPKFLFQGIRFSEGVSSHLARAALVGGAVGVYFGGRVAVGGAGAAYRAMDRPSGGNSYVLGRLAAIGSTSTRSGGFPDPPAKPPAPRSGPPAPPPPPPAGPPPGSGPVRPRPDQGPSLRLLPPGGGQPAAGEPA